MRRARACGFGVLAVLAVVGLPARPAAAQVGTEHIQSYNVAIAIQADGSLNVEERISYDFGFTPHHGIFRDIPVRFDYEPDSKYERLTTIDQVKVTAVGASAKLAIEEQGRLKRLRIGDAKKTVTGAHDYTIDYRVRGALDAYEEHDELKWNAVGTGWEAPISHAAVTVRTPGPVVDVACFSGPLGSQLPCRQATVGDGPGATFAHDNLHPHEALTVVIGMPKGEVTVPPPILDERWAFSRAFSVTPATGAASGGILVLVMAGMARVFRIGRDRRYRGSHVDVAFGSVSGEEETVPLFERQHDPVELEPPDKIRPGQVGTLIDESADPLDVSATIVDLAVRGYLTIEEVPKEGWFGKPDWTLTKKKDGEGLLRYEELLLNGLFEGGEEVTLSSLKRHFAPRLKKVENALYDDVVKSGWFKTRPDRVRAKWGVVGVLAIVVALAVTIVLAAVSHAGLLGVPLVVGALALMLFAHRAPSRTPKGYATLRRVNGFRQFIEFSEKERARFAERANLFSEYLPYAVVFGATEKWAKAFSGLDDEVAAATRGWYISPNPFLLGSFASSMDGFAVTTAGTIVAAAPSSSSGLGGGGGGFSGGGFGGGGGGSW